MDLTNADEDEREELIREAKRRNTKYGELIESEEGDDAASSVSDSSETSRESDDEE